jgi:hypothetical protein
LENRNSDPGEEKLYLFTEAGTSLRAPVPKEIFVSISHKKNGKTRIISGRGTQRIFRPICVFAERMAGSGFEK